MTPAKTPKRRSPRARYTPADIKRLKLRVLAAIAGGPKRKPKSIAGAADAAGVPTRTVHQWRDDDPAFNEAVEAAKRDGAERLEDHILGRSDRVKRRTYRFDEQGQRYLWQEEIKDELAHDRAILDRRAPIPQGVELTGKDGGPIQAVDPEARYAAWLAMRAVLLARDDMRPLGAAINGRAADALPVDKGAADAD